MNKKKSSFSGQLGFVLAAAGSAVGVGNLWRFPYLKKHPYLLPFAWGQRLCGYLREGPVLGSVKEIVKTGRKRKEILREYGIFGEKRR